MHSHFDSESPRAARCDALSAVPFAFIRAASAVLIAAILGCSPAPVTAPAGLPQATSAPPPQESALPEEDRQRSEWVSFTRYADERLKRYVRTLDVLNRDLTLGMVQHFDALQPRARRFADKADTWGNWFDSVFDSHKYRQTVKALLRDEVVKPEELAAFLASVFVRYQESVRELEAELRKDLFLELAAYPTIRPQVELDVAAFQAALDDCVERICEEQRAASVKGVVGYICGMLVSRAVCYEVVQGLSDVPVPKTELAQKMARTVSTFVDKHIQGFFVSDDYLESNALKMLTKLRALASEGDEGAHQELKALESALATAAGPAQEKECETAIEKLQESGRLGLRGILDLASKRAAAVQHEAMIELLKPPGL